MPNKRKIIPSNAPFTSEEAEWLDHFFTQMSPEQGTWLNGFVSGFQAMQLTGSTAPYSQDALIAQQGSGSPQPPANVTQSNEKQTLLVLFGSESGNAEGLADDAKKLAIKAGMKAKLVDMADISPAELALESNVLVVVSTWGEGAPPERATEFYNGLMSIDAPKLGGVNFGVLGLGDTSYDQFCKMGKDIDRRLEELGGNRAIDRIDCDVDYEDAAGKWINDALDIFGKSPNQSADVVIEVNDQPSSNTVPAVTYGKKNPFPAELTNRVVLNGTGSSKETLHLELSLEGSGMSYLPGDSLAVLPVNCDEVVSDIIKASGLTNEQVVTNKQGNSVDLHSHIMNECDATVLSKVFIQKYNELSPNEELTKLLLPENKSTLQEFVWGREILDLLLEYPISDLSPENLIGLLRRLPPRLYSIASSLKASPDEVHLTVAAVRYYAHQRNRKGVCSTFLADRINVGGKIPVYVQPNKHFKLPQSSDTPMIMVGPGTGVAPFRSFMQDRQATGAQGKNWLFYGDQHFSYDFLYQLEWQDYFKDGVLSKIDTAFSRDTPEKVYVQHRMIEKSKEIYQWLEEGAHFYVCGDASRMANDVHSALQTILTKEGSMSEDNANEYLDKLKKEKRYQRDVY